MPKRFYEIIDHGTDTIYLGVAEDSTSGVLHLKNHISMGFDTYNILKPGYNGLTSTEISKQIWKNTPEKNKTDHPLNLDGLVVSTLDLKE